MGGKHRADGDHVRMGKVDASRIQSAAARHPESDTAISGFAERAQSAADRGAEHPDDEDEDED